MNFDVPLIQELGRSRRLPHSIGVVYLALTLASKCNLDAKSTKHLLAAALLHDAAIPPYGHLVEAEFKQHWDNISHEQVLKRLISGELGYRNIYEEIVPGKCIELKKILDAYDIDYNIVVDLVCPKKKGKTPISADIDIDNIDNIHRMGVMLGWDGVRENIKCLIDKASINGLKNIYFDSSAEFNIKQWLDYRQRIYTMIIAHPECIPQNALQSDIVSLAVNNKIISPENWYITEPEFEEKLRSSPETRDLAYQLISGCQYSLVDYVWFKNFRTEEKISNSIVRLKFHDILPTWSSDLGYFVWYEKALISREIKWIDQEGRKRSTGEDSRSCLVAIIKKSKGNLKITNSDRIRWRSDAVESFESLIRNRNFDVEFPENYSGSFYSIGQNELQLSF
jgi:HD superfamily phosphohydrolase